MPRYMLSVFGPAERSEFGDYRTKEDMLRSLKDTGRVQRQAPGRGRGVALPDRGVLRGAARVVTAHGVRAAITQAHREGWARVVAALTRRFGDLDVAEDAAAEAFATAGGEH